MCEIYLNKKEVYTSMVNHFSTIIYCKGGKKGNVQSVQGH